MASPEGWWEPLLLSVNQTAHLHIFLKSPFQTMIFWINGGKVTEILTLGLESYPPTIT